MIEELQNKVNALLKNAEIDKDKAEILIDLINKKAINLSDLEHIETIKDIIEQNTNHTEEPSNNIDVVDGRIQDARTLEAPTLTFDQINELPDSVMDNRDVASHAMIKERMADTIIQNSDTDKNDHTITFNHENTPPLMVLSEIFTSDFLSETNKTNSLIQFRNITANGNNIDNPSWGQSGTAILIMSEAQYADGIAAPADIGKPNARDISNLIFNQPNNMDNQKGVSNYLWVWGQFIDHDIVLTKEGHIEDFFIDVPAGDIHFDPFNTGRAHIEFTRSAAIEGSGTDIDNPRQQQNEITAFIDASNVYGSTETLQTSLRGEDGKLLIDENDLLPTAVGDRGIQFIAGDTRASENIGLTSMHTIFVREHNRLVDELAQKHPNWDEETLYQTAKAIVEGKIQHITYTAFLPILLGNNALEEYEGYDATVNPQIASEFSTAAFRVGHTMLASTIARMQENGDESVFGDLTLQNAFFRSDIIMREGIDEAMRGLSATLGQTIDAHIINDVRNFLFGPPGAGGFDLASLNIQRGRDHGLADFNTVREAYGLDPIADFHSLTNDTELADRLETLYESIDNLDLWVGGLLETPHGTGLVGETFNIIIAEQFTRLRNGDRFWYETRFEGEFLEDILETSLADIIRNNSNIEYIQNDIFQAANRIGGNNEDNVLIGTEENDLLIGFDGDDILNAHEGENTLYGGLGADEFIISQIDDQIDIIMDFDGNEGDRINISNILDNYNPTHNNLENFVRLIANDNETHTLMVDIDGTMNAHEFTAVALLEAPDQFNLNAIISSQGLMT